MEGLGIFAVILVLILYFLPTIIAYQRDHDSQISIFFVNLFLGWTVIVWLAAVIWAASGTKTVIVRAATPDTHIKCPDCRELILKDARVCKHCGCKLIPEQDLS